MLGLKVEGTDRLVAALRRAQADFPRVVTAGLKRAGREVTREAQTIIMQKFQRGGVSLRRSITWAPRQPTDRVLIGSDKVFAAIHEFGGRTRPHIIKPRNKKALRFPIGPVVGMRGRTVRKQSGNWLVLSAVRDFQFVGRSSDPNKGVVHHPGSVIPARPYLRPAYENVRDKIIEGFRQELQRAIRR